jgi:hypothetical protein
MDGFLNFFCSPQQSGPDICGCSKATATTMQPVPNQPKPNKPASAPATPTTPAVPPFQRNGSYTAMHTNEMYDSHRSVSESPVSHRMAGIGCAFESGEGIGLLVHSLVAGGPADSCGLIRKGDELVSVDGIDVRGMGAGELAQVLIGPVGTSVRVAFLRGHPAGPRQSVSVELIRQQSYNAGSNPLQEESRKKWP